MLAELNAYWAERDPDWNAGLRPGLSAAELRAAESQMAPFRLTAEQKVLYQWHDGDGDRRAFGDGLPPFLDLAQALEGWRLGHQKMDWTPCWMPLLSGGRDYRIALIDSSPVDESAVLEFFLEDGELKVLVPSIEALVRWHLDCLREGVHLGKTDAWTAEAKAAELRLLTPYAGRVVIRGEPLEAVISALWARTWPAAWRKAAGIDETAAIPVEVTTTAADLLAGTATEGVIEGTITALAFTFSPESAVAELDDGTGRVLVGCPVGVPGVREIAMNFVMQMTVGPRPTTLKDELFYLEGLIGGARFIAKSVRFIRDLGPLERS